MIAAPRHGLAAAPRAALICVLALMFMPARNAAAQGNSLQIPLQFDFLNPGAKSLALGGAFAGLADDATATFANPAGLTQLNASEVSIEGRGSWVSTPFLAGGRLSGTPTGIGIDTVSSPIFTDSNGSHGGVGFLAGVYMHPSRTWVVAGYRHELARVDQTFFSTGVFRKDPAEANSRRDLPQSGARAVSITGYGVSGSYKVHPLVAIGGSLTAYDFTLTSLFRRFDHDGFSGAPLTSVELGRSSQNGDGVAWAPTVGVMIGGGDRRVGLVYRRGPSFDMTTVRPVLETADLTEQKAGQFRVPDTLGLGASMRVQQSLTLALEITRVGYSRLRDDFVTDQTRGGNGRGAGFSIDDGTEVHGGVQYAVTRWRGIPRFRAGAWFDPDHSIHYAPPGPALNANDRLADELFSTALSKGANHVHITGGVGLTFSPHLEFNAAFDAAPTTRIFSSSLILR